MASIKAIGHVCFSKNVRVHLTSRFLASTFTQGISNSNIHTYSKGRAPLVGKNEFCSVFQGQLRRGELKLPTNFTSSGGFVIIPQNTLLRIMSSSSSQPKDNLSSSPRSTADSSDNQAPEAETVSSAAVPPKQALSNKEKLKQAVRDYGATVLVFHVTMSLMSLGVCYLLVQSGLDVTSILAKLGISESILQSKATEEAGKFVVAYAIHKVFAPVRITITLTATNFIVRKLRSMGILKEMARRKID